MSNQGPSYPQDQPPPGWQPQPPQYQQPEYQQPQYQPPYGQPAYGAGPPDQIRFQAPGPTVEHPRATLAFVLGLLAVLGLTILGPFGWYWGNRVVAEIDRDPRPYSNRGIAMAGKVLGIIGTVFLILTVLLIVAVVVFAIAAPSSRY